MKYNTAPSNASWPKIKNEHKNLQNSVAKSQENTHSNKIGAQEYTLHDR